jgi:hypothetical protein
LFFIRPNEVHNLLEFGIDMVPNSVFCFVFDRGTEQCCAVYDGSMYTVAHGDASTSQEASGFPVLEGTGNLHCCCASKSHPISTPARHLSLLVI